MTDVTVAALQMACADDRAANLDRAEALVREAAGAGANIILLQELFETPYFCKTQDPAHFALAASMAEQPALARLHPLAAELGVVLPVSFFERAGPAFFNSLVVFDADGTIAGHYRKSHIPDGPGYQEKFYFSPGDTGFAPVRTRFGTLGCAICWDQWFPEAARVLVLRGAEILLYPTAIGSEPQDPSLDSSGHWQRTMQGHAAANMVPLVAANRVGTERQGDVEMTFYGRSFIADPTGAMVAEAGSEDGLVLTARFDMEAIGRQRQSWGLFRHRRPELYHPILSLDGSAEVDW